MASRLGAAMLISGAIGLERQIGKHPAGLRTHILVGLGCATFVIGGQEWLAALTTTVPDAQASAIGSSADLSRMLQGLIGGVGFLGAGAVFHAEGGLVKGMTTAASIWVTAALGMACGLGLYPLALLSGIGTLFTLFVLALAEKRFKGLFAHEHAREKPPAP